MTTVRTERLRIIGIHCASCLYAIQKSLSRVRGVLEFKADITSGDALIKYDVSLTKLSEVVKAIRDAGYDVLKNSFYLAIPLDEEEVSAFEDFVSELEGVIECRASSIAGLANILYNPLTTSQEVLTNAIRLKYPSAREVSEEAAGLNGSSRGEDLMLSLTSFTLGLTSVAYHTVGTFGVSLPFWTVREYLLFITATAVIILCSNILSRGIRSLLRGTPTMESLVTVSSISSYFFSLLILFGIIHAEETFFEASAGVLGFISAGKYLEERLKGRATEELRKLVKLQEGKVRVIRNGSTAEVDVSEVVPGDLIEVRAGEKIYVDGVVVEGYGYVDESTFTGEPLPRLKTSERADVVLAGTTMTSGFIKVRATRVGDDTNLAYIVRAVKEAQFYKPAFQRIADRVAGLLTWVVLALSITTFTYWFLLGNVGMSRSVLFAVAVLVVACPCPLGIAIPMVVSVATIKAAKSGILVRKGDVFERILSVDSVFFDKTGTITVGEPALLDVITFNEFSKDELIEYVCTAERRSEHPLAKAILKQCNNLEINDVGVEDYEHLPGLGLIARVNGVEVAVGSEKLMEELGVRLDNSVEDVVENITSKGFTAIIVAVNREVAAVMKVGDTVRSEVVDVVKYFKNLGLKTALVTGDSRRVGEAVVKTAKIDLLYAELNPEDKAELIDELQKRGSRIMFIGDGVNDAPAISTSFVGVAMGAGANISREAGDVVIVSNNLKSLIALHQLSRRVRRKGLENLLWAFMYNVVLLPVAMGVFYTSVGLALRPELAAAAMMLSDISVILNTLTLVRWEPRASDTTTSF
ncbi:MAG: heavy metal translocating P-type ATPase [Sulfolobales archaeon]